MAFAGTAPTFRPQRVRARRTTANVGTTGSPSSTFKRDVYRRLFDAYWPRVRHHLDCYIDDREEVLEISADVFLLAWSKLDPANPMPLTWFLRTADNKIRDRTRRARTRERALQALTRRLEDPESPVDVFEASALRNAVAALNARERQVVVLTYWDELSAREVAELLRSTEAAVWTTLSRARTKLREQLKGWRV